MKNRTVMISMAVAAMVAAAPLLALGQDNQGQGQAVVTILPKHDGELPPSVANQDLAVKVDGKNARVTKWTPLRGPGDTMELVVLIDGSARNSLGSQLESIAHFLKALPPNAKAGVAYMQSGRAVFAGPLSADHEQVAGELRLPGGSPGSDSSPYFCLSDLATHWPSQDRAARREVVMVTDGVDNYQPQFDPSDPYVESAIKSSVQAGLIVYSIYWRSQGFADRSPEQSNGGQSLLSEVADATGGKTFWQGSGNPVSIEPFLDELTRRFRNQYELGFTAHLGSKAAVESLKLKLSAPDTEVDAPQEVIVYPAAPTKN
jgi:hypothetical protein